ncbi:hypothetical protein [Acidisphaera sp. L21]|uniref:hypothetical protein n=1 Tax=Acidisphaera sp. L21 TaxID=1641851 RepID=UPI00131EA052|nr:hypothetical protein [Acidisphaera sp. L21]
MAEADTYMTDMAEALANSLRLTDGKSGYVEAQGDVLHVFVRRKWSGKQMASWNGSPIEWHENVGTNKAANR